VPEVLAEQDRRATYGDRNGAAHKDNSTLTPQRSSTRWTGRRETVLGRDQLEVPRIVMRGQPVGHYSQGGENAAGVCRGEEPPLLSRRRRNVHTLRMYPVVPHYTVSSLLARGAGGRCARWAGGGALTGEGLATLHAAEVDTERLLHPVEDGFVGNRLALLVVRD
jgi:hypothetical protein